MYAKLKELAKTNKFYRGIFITMIAIAVFCRLVKRYHFIRKERRKSEEKSEKISMGHFFRKLGIEVYVGAALVVALLFSTIIESYASDKKFEDLENRIKNDVENKMKPLREVTFEYKRGVGKRLFDGEVDLAKAPTAEYPKEAVSENDVFRLNVKAEGFAGVIHEGQSDAVYPIVIRNSGQGVLSDIQVDTQGMQLYGYNEKLSSLIQEALALEELNETEENNETDTGDIVEDTEAEENTDSTETEESTETVNTEDVEDTKTEDDSESLDKVEKTQSENEEENNNTADTVEELENRKPEEDESKDLEKESENKEQEEETETKDLEKNIESKELEEATETECLETESMYKMPEKDDDTEDLETESESTESEEETEIEDSETEQESTELEEDTESTDNKENEQDTSEIENSEITDTEGELEDTESEEATEITDKTEEIKTGESEESTELTDTTEALEEKILESIEMAVGNTVTSEDIEEKEEKLDTIEQVDSDLIEKTVNAEEEILTLPELNELHLSLLPGEEVIMYLALPQECTYGEYTDQIQVRAKELIQPCVIDVKEKIYANEGEPWQIIPDKSNPFISYEKEKYVDGVAVFDGFDFQVWENELSDSGISKVECYLNGNLLELDPEILKTSQHGEEEVILGEAYHVDFAEPGIQSLSIQAFDCEGNQSISEMEILSVKEEEYCIRLPEKIRLLVDPDMASKNGQIYNMEDFMIENDSIDDIIVNMEELNVDVKDDGEGKKCSLDMALIVDGEKLYTVPVTEKGGENLCKFLLKGKGDSSEKPHQAYLVFTGGLEGKNKNNWHEGDIEIQYQIKFSAVD